MMGIIHAEHWRKARADYMDAARSCKAVLTDPNGYWKYAPDDRRVKKALAAWILRARNAHAIALGRRPLIENFTYITPNEPPRHGALYAR